MKTLTQINLFKLSSFKSYSFAEQFIDIINEKAEDYGRNNDLKANLKGFFEDLQQGGCISGMIAEFIYHEDCKAFYIEHIDDLEEFVKEIQEYAGDIKNIHDLPRYTFIVWVAFEEFCLNLYSNIFND